MRRWLLTVALLGALASPVAADDLSTSEKAWARACVAGLTAPSARQRESAAAALARLGTAAIPTILSGVSSLKTDDQWAALERALVGMGAADALKELEKREKEWPAAAAVRRTATLEHLRTAASEASTPAGANGAPPVAGDVASKVRSILASFSGQSSFSSADTRTQQLIALGRPAVKPLLDALKRADSLGFGAKAAAEALQQLLGVDDMPAVRQLLEDGHLAVAPALARLPAEAAIPALLAPLAKGMNAFELIEGLQPFKRDPRVQAAMIRWLKGEPDTGGSSLIGSTAQALAEGDARDAVPVLLALVGNEGRMNRLQVAEALVTLGERRGIETLLDIVRKPASEFDRYDRHAAAERLNKVSRLGVYRGSYEPGGSGNGNFDEAVPKFEAWWEEVKDTIRFDENRGAWVTK